MDRQRIKHIIIEYAPWALAGLAITLVAHCAIYINFDHSQRYIFVHIPKTGGTSFNQWIDAQHEKGQCKAIRSAHTHYLDARSAHRMGYQPIAIIREPTERFISSFYYWRFGSQDIPQWQRPKDWQIASDINSPEALINLLRNPQHPQHNSIKQAIMQRNQFTHLHHFLPQTLWLNQPKGKATIVCYDAKQLNQHLQQAISTLAIDCPVINMPNTNKTLKKQHATLSPAAKRWLLEVYDEDYQLWQKHCQSKQKTTQ